MVNIDDEPGEFELTAQEAQARGLADAVPYLKRVELGARAGADVDAEENSGAGISAVSWGSPGAVDQADAGARTVVLHGAALNAHTWDAMLLYWGVPALVFDLPGHGESDWRADADYSPATLAAALDPALDRARERGLLADGPLTLVGHSLGGLTSFGLAGLRDDIEHIVAVDALPGIAPASEATPSPSAPDPLAAFVAQFEQLVAGPESYDSREQIVQQAAALGFGGPALESVRRGVIHNTRVRLDGRVEWKHHIAKLGSDQAVKLISDPQPLWGALAETQAKVDLVRAARGIVTDGQVERLLELKPQARIVETDTGHNVHEEQPEALARILAQLV